MLDKNEVAIFVGIPKNARTLAVERGYFGIILIKKLIIIVKQALFLL
jgi:hypothetical protein